jgi:adenosylmethionine-8-amino-7-oxononanoate aminotransferase
MAALDRASIDLAGPGLPVISHGRGLRVWDREGRSWIDGSGGPAVFSLGHGNEEVNAAIADQLGRIAYGYRYTFTSDPLEELTALIAES